MHKDIPKHAKDFFVIVDALRILLLAAIAELPYSRLGW
jgi:hypothetical protein